MESLKDTKWDVLITGTGLKQSLLALSLSRSNLRVLHADHNAYYGGNEAALSLQEAESWCRDASSENEDVPTSFADATVNALNDDGSGDQRLGSYRAYNLALAPQIVYTRSKLLPLLVSSGVHEQLEFLAVGSWWVYEPAHEPDSASASPQGRLTKVPSSREDIFADDQLNIRHKRALVKFLRFIAEYQAEENLPTWQPHASTPFASFLSSEFNVPGFLHPALLSLTMSRKRSNEITTEAALAAIYRHLTSMNVFGPGFAAVLPKWGGLSEIGQVGCRAMAVGGGVYILNQAIESANRKVANLETGENVGANASSDEVHWSVAFNNEESVEARVMVDADHGILPIRSTITGLHSTESSTERTAHAINIVSSPLASLFPPVAEGAPLPAGAVVVFPYGDIKPDSDRALKSLPVHCLIHNADTGECPLGQCVVYSSITLPQHSAGMVRNAFDILQDAVQCLLTVVDEAQSTPRPRILWHMQYTQSHSSSSSFVAEENLIKFSSVTSEVALGDDVVDEVRQAWRRIVGTGVDDAEFMKFAKRRGEEEEEIDGSDSDCGDDDNE